MARSAGVVRNTTVTPHPVIEMANGSKIEFRSWEREQNLMGTSIAGGVIDEAGLLSPQAQAAISTRRSSTLGPLRYIGNPGVAAGPFRKLCSLGEEANARPDSRWRGVYSLHKWTWEDKLHALAGPQAEAYQVFIEQERASLPEYEFRRLYEAEWTEDEAAVFRGVHEATQGAPLEQAADGDYYCIGVDVAQVSDYLVAIGIGTGSRRAEVIERFRGIPYPQAAARIQALTERFPAQLVVETNGPGIALIQELDRLGVSYLPFTTTSQSKQEAILNLSADLHQGRLHLAEMPPLQYELATYRYQRLPSGHYRYEAPQGEHDDCVMALALAAWGLPRITRSGDFGWLA